MSKTISIISGYLLALCYVLVHVCLQKKKGKKITDCLTMINHILS